MAVVECAVKKCTGCGICAGACPFSAIDMKDGVPDVQAGCKACGICVKKCPEGALAMGQGGRSTQRLEDYKGILVYAEQFGGRLSGVSLELLGEARRMAAVCPQPVYAVAVGEGARSAAHGLIRCGADKVYCMDDSVLSVFIADRHTTAVMSIIDEVKPSIVLIGATKEGRSLAPRLAARCGTGLTADCTKLEIRENSELVQIRPAFGGNIMAQIVTKQHRPQFATVRPKVMDEALPVENPSGTIVEKMPDAGLLETGVEVLGVKERERKRSILDSPVLVVAGRGVKKQADLEVLEALAERLGGMTACTRPLVEMGWMEHERQIGLSGRSVKPKLAITCGVSGAIQFAVGIKSAELLIAINTDADAPIFKYAHYALVGDLYEVLPELERLLGEEAENDGNAV